jgi:lysophospholipase L1-like esterase
VTDAVGQSAACAFKVNVALKVLINGTRLWAFGDSITEGQVSDIFGIRTLQPANSYPSVLRGLLSDRYLLQTITVENFGVSGEHADSDDPTADGLGRLRRYLDTLPVPDALLLLEGSNEMMTRSSAEIATIVPALASDISYAKLRGVKQVFLATFPPVRSGTHGSYVLQNNGSSSLSSVNAAMRSLAAQTGVVLVDLHAGMAGEEATLIGDDGLHPTKAGYARIASIFFEAIKKNFETNGFSAALGSLRR